MKRIAIIQSNYIPWKGYFDMIGLCDAFVIYDEVQYTKNDWRNRNLIKTPRGVEWLTIPVRQQTLDQRIDETFVAQENWSKKHWNSLVANYSKAPFFGQFETPLKEIYSTVNSSNLSDINRHFIRKICDILGIQTPFIQSIDLSLTGDKNERLIDAVRKLDGTHYLSGPAARNYLNTDAFTNAGLTVEWMDYAGYTEYDQLYPPFTHGVSILDLIFQVGDDAKNYMKWGKKDLL